MTISDHPHGSTRILVADADPDLGETLVALLEEEGLHVATASDGAAPRARDDAAARRDLRRSATP